MNLEQAHVPGWVGIIVLVIILVGIVWLLKGLAAPAWWKSSSYSDPTDDAAKDSEDRLRALVNQNRNER